MKHSRAFLSLAILLTVLPMHGAFARYLRIFTPQELTDKSSIVCTGVVTEIVPLDERGFRHDEKGAAFKNFGGINEPIPAARYAAKIKVLAVLKGHAGKEVEMRYSHIVQPVVNGPWEIELQVHKRYRFYLKQDSRWNPFLVPCTEGAFDDGGAAELMSDKEADNHAAMRIADAIKIAMDYGRRKYGESFRDAGNDVERFCYDNYAGHLPGWSLRFYYGEPKDKKPMVYVMVHHDGTIEK